MLPVQVILAHGWSDRAVPSGLGQWSMEADGRKDPHQGRKDHLLEHGRKDHLLEHANQNRLEFLKFKALLILP